MGILVTSDYLLNYYPPNTSASVYIKNNINFFKNKFFGISGSLQYVSGSDSSAYFDKNIVYSFTGSTRNEIRLLNWAYQHIGTNENIHLTMSIYNTNTGRSKLHKYDPPKFSKEPWTSRLEKKKLVKLILKVYGDTITETKQKEIKQYKIKASDIKITVKKVLGVEVMTENIKF
jgi:hypothetical protein